MSKTSLISASGRRIHRPNRAKFARWKENERPEKGMFTKLLGRIWLSLI